MPKPGEHKTVQERILQYAQDIGWTLVSRAEAGKRRVNQVDLAVLDALGIDVDV
jgi:type I restriction enzyme R subunit